VASTQHVRVTLSLRQAASWFVIPVPPLLDRAIALSPHPSRDRLVSREFM
jgi:hypothetical protein